MLPILDTDGIREADRQTIEDLGVPGLVLMENAATGLVDAVREEYPETRSIAILCGGGNNGGDGLAAARHFHNGGLRVRVGLLCEPGRLTTDAAANYRSAVAFGVDVELVLDDNFEAVRQWFQHASPPDLVVDAILGTGLTRALDGRLARIADMLNTCDVPVVAVDVPTGLDGSSTCLPGPVIEAELTVTFAAIKRCHALPPACALCGQVVIVDIGIPPHALEAGAEHWMVEADDISLLLPHRPPTAHKGTFGHLLIVAGARGRGGAATMAGHAAVAMGSGLVSIAVPSPVVAVVDGACLESMTIELPAGDDGEAAGPGDLWSLAQHMTAAVIGPGLGVGRGAQQVVSEAIARWQGPLLFDADAINCCAGVPERIAHRDAPTVLTPHPGELARLIGWETERVVDNRLAAALEAARRADAIVVAKGYRTVVADPEGRAWVNPTGDQHLASGGSGDVLAGTIGAFLAQGLDPTRAAAVGVWLHGRAGEIGASDWPAAVPATQLPSLLASAWSELELDT